jgi:hypothetical protein
MMVDGEQHSERVIDLVLDMRAEIRSPPDAPAHCCISRCLVIQQDRIRPNGELDLAKARAAMGALDCERVARAACPFGRSARLTSR